MICKYLFSIYEEICLKYKILKISAKEDVFPTVNYSKSAKDTEFNVKELQLNFMYKEIDIGIIIFSSNIHHKFPRFYISVRDALHTHISQELCIHACNQC